MSHSRLDARPHIHPIDTPTPSERTCAPCPHCPHCPPPPPFHVPIHTRCAHFLRRSVKRTPRGRRNCLQRFPPKTHVLSCSAASSKQVPRPHTHRPTPLWFLPHKPPRCCAPAPLSVLVVPPPLHGASPRHTAASRCGALRLPQRLFPLRCLAQYSTRGSSRCPSLRHQHFPGKLLRCAPLPRRATTSASVLARCASLPRRTTSGCARPHCVLLCLTAPFTCSSQRRCMGAERRRAAAQRSGAVEGLGYWFLPFRAGGLRSRPDLWMRSMRTSLWALPPPPPLPPASAVCPFRPPSPVALPHHDWLSGRHFADMAVQVRYGDAIDRPHIRWHCDGPSSLLRLALQAHGTRALHLKDSQVRAPLTHVPTVRFRGAVAVRPGMRLRGQEEGVSQVAAKGVAGGWKSGTGVKVWRVQSGWRGAGDGPQSGRDGPTCEPRTAGSGGPPPPHKRMPGLVCPSMFPQRVIGQWEFPSPPTCLSSTPPHDLPPVVTAAPPPTLLRISNSSPPLVHLSRVPLPPGSIAHRSTFRRPENPRTTSGGRSLGMCACQRPWPSSTACSTRRRTGSIPPWPSRSVEGFRGALGRAQGGAL